MCAWVTVQAESKNKPVVKAIEYETYDDLPCPKGVIRLNAIPRVKPAAHIKPLVGRMEVCTCFVALAF